MSSISKSWGKDTKGDGSAYSMRYERIQYLLLEVLMSVVTGDSNYAKAKYCADDRENNSEGKEEYDGMF